MTPKKRFSVEQIVAKLHQIEVLSAGGTALAQARKEAGITEVTYSLILAQPQLL